MAQYPERPATAGVIYFIRCPLNRRVRIGFTTASPEARLKALRTSSPVEIELVGSVPAARMDETRLHGLFWRQHLWGEWFDTSPELEALLARIAAGSFSPVSLLAADLGEWLAGNRTLWPEIVRLTGIPSMSLRHIAERRRVLLRGPTFGRLSHAREALSTRPHHESAHG